MRELDPNLFSPEKFVLRSRGRWLTFEHCIELVMVLPGKVAKESRLQFVDIIRRYIAGDPTLTTEIQANAQSSSPVAQMARESLNIETEEDLTRKRRREDLELERLQQEIQDRKAASIGIQQKNMLTFMETMEKLDPDWMDDTRLVMLTKDRLKTISLGQQSIENGQDKQDDPIYIADVARELGFSKLSHGDSCKIGRKATELYREKHSAPPKQRKQFVDGAERLVNAYTEADRDVLTKAVVLCMEKK